MSKVGENEKKFKKLISDRFGTGLRALRHIKITMPMSVFPLTT